VPIAAANSTLCRRNTGIGMPHSAGRLNSLTHRRAGKAVVGCPVAAMLPVPPPLQRQKCMVHCRCCNCMLVMCIMSSCAKLYMMCQAASACIRLQYPAAGCLCTDVQLPPAVSSPAKGCFWQVEADGRQCGGVQRSSSGRQRPAAALPLPQQRPQLCQNRDYCCGSTVMPWVRPAALHHRSCCRRSCGTTCMCGHISLHLPAA
jgi:hypothetical protein